MTGRVRPGSVALLVAAALAATAPAEAQTKRLGPADGHELPAVDTGRVRVGAAAPDFTLESITGSTVTLSGFRSKKTVVLVFYRGHW